MTDHGEFIFLMNVFSDLLNVSDIAGAQVLKHGYAPFKEIILLYHGVSVWFWMGNQKKIGYHLVSTRFRIVWSSLNIISGLLAIILA
jgi:hypothetical protein